MARLFASDPDPGVHSAAEWALRSWDLEDRLADLTKPLLTTSAVADRRWYINRAGHTMVVFRKPGDVQVGSPKDEPNRDSDEEIQTRRIDRDFSISTTETTFEQFAKFKPDFRHQKRGEQTATPEGPVVMLTWHRAAQYCNWLSAEEGIPSDQWCYTITDNVNAMPADDYLTRTGYRLPTETEWEYACRAGTTTAYSWGNDPEMFRRFSWAIEISMGQVRPVGELCPNQFGLFDMHGNAGEWTQNIFRYSKGREVTGSGPDVEETGFFFDGDRIVRGGNAAEPGRHGRSANRSPSKAKSGVSSRLGFRVARTLNRSKI
jgi:formylglycine-generating enzyme required for sulfatase activity